MNTRHDHYALSHGHGSHPVTLLSAAVAAADRALLNALELHAEIRVRAFHRWEAAGRPADDGVRFWREAEQELAAEHDGAPADLHDTVNRKHDGLGQHDGHDRHLDHSLAAQASEENARALNASVDSHYRDNNRMFQRHGDRGHRHGSNND
jgi:hypothetical protein